MECAEAGKNTKERKKQTQVVEEKRKRGENLRN